MTFKKRESLLPVLLLIGAILLAFLYIPSTVGGQQSMGPQGQPATGQQYRQDAGGGGPLTIPGLEGIQGLAQGPNAAMMSVKVVSREQDKIYVEATSIALASPKSKSAMVYGSASLPGVIDTKTNEIQIDVSGLSAAAAPRQVAANDLMSTMRPSTDTLMVNVMFSPARVEDKQTTFDVRKVAAVTPDGKMTDFDLKKPIQAVFEKESMRVYTAGFPELYDMLNKFMASSQGNEYASVSPSISQGPTVPVMPPMVVPVLVPIPIVPLGPWPPGPGPGPWPQPHCEYCPPGMVCDTATQNCVPYQECHPPCAAGQVCNAATGTCGAWTDCPGGACGINEVCDRARGQCVPRHTCQPPCPNGMVCGASSGTCVSARGCSGACPGGQTCDYISGECVAVKPCGACAAPNVCDELTGHCRAPSEVPCGGPCPGGQVCRSDLGRCDAPLTCPACAAGEVCDSSSGHCVKQCVPACQQGTRCVNGQCQGAYFMSRKPNATASPAASAKVTAKPSARASASASPTVKASPSAKASPTVSPKAFIGASASPRATVSPMATGKPSLAPVKPTFKPSYPGVVSPRVPRGNMASPRASVKPGTGMGGRFGMSTTSTPTPTPLPRRGR